MSKRIILLTPGFGKGGAEKQLFLLACHLQSKGFTVKIVSLLDRNMYQKELELNNIEFESLFFEKKNIITRFISYKRMIITFKPDIIISFMFAANLLSRITKIFYSCVVISSIRNEVFGGKLSEHILKLTNRLDDATVVNSDTVLEKLVEAKILDPQKSISIPNVVDISNITDEGRTKVRHEVRLSLGISNDKFVFLFVANYRPQKDYENLLMAISHLEEDFIVVMTGNLYNSTWPIERAKELKIECKVKILGKQDNMSAYYLAADALVLSSQWEGLPNVILEAMSFKVPVVSTNVGGVKDLITHGYNGLLSVPKDYIKLAEAMREMLNLPTTELNKMGRISENLIYENFIHSAIMSKWDHVISST